jgi:large subunit ribosomal protein L15
MGWGQVAQHRKHSQKGGRKVGSHKHLWSYVIKYEPDYFGKKGFIPRNSKTKINTINVGELNELVDKLAKAKQLEKKEDKAFIDLDKLGYQKLLATGKITKPVIVKVTTHSKNAAKKIEEAGGQLLSGEEKKAEKESEEFEAETEKSEAESTDVETSDKS